MLAPRCFTSLWSWSWWQFHLWRCDVITSSLKLKKQKNSPLLLFDVPVSVFEEPKSRTALLFTVQTSAFHRFRAKLLTWNPNQGVLHANILSCVQLCNIYIHLLVNSCTGWNTFPKKCVSYSFCASLIRCLLSWLVFFFLMGVGGSLIGDCVSVCTLVLLHRLSSFFSPHSPMLLLGPAQNGESMLDCLNPFRPLSFSHIFLLQMMGFNTKAYKLTRDAGHYISSYVQIATRVLLVEVGCTVIT